MIRVRSALLACALICFSRATFAQEPTPRDSTPSTGAQVIQDSVRPIPQLTDHFYSQPIGFANGVWEWTQSDFELEATTSLLDFLQQLPGVLPVRTGWLVQPEAAAVLGATANRLEVYLDGYQLDPITESSIDLSKIELVHVAKLRIERRLGLTRIFIRTNAAADTRAYSRVEAGIGQPDANMFRGILLVPKLFFGPFGVAIDRKDTDGFFRNEPGDQFAGWAKWSYIRGKSGLQVQYRRVSTDRDDDVPWDAEHTRDDVIAQLRINVRDHFVAELFGGRSTFEGDTADPASAPDIQPKIHETVTQYGGTLSFDVPFAWARAGVRLRDNDLLAKLQADAAGGLRAGKYAAVNGEFTLADWGEAGRATWFGVHGHLAPVSFLKLFGEFTHGRRGAPALFGSFDRRPFVFEQTAYRAGGEISWRGFSIGAAFLHLESDSASVFGLPFDTSFLRVAGPTASDGWELSARVPLLLEGLSGFATVTNWVPGQLTWYLPARQFRGGLELHSSPLPSGNLELFGRFEAVHRGGMFVPGAFIPETTTFDAYAQIRIIDVRLFGRFEDIAGQNTLEVPGRIMPGPRIFYGVKWQFWN